MYDVRITIGNGYRCPCCLSVRDERLSFTDLEKALTYVPVNHIHYPDEELIEVVVIDSETAEEVAKAILTFTSEFSTYSGYYYAKWSGYRPDMDDPWEKIYNKQGKEVTDKTWEECVDDARQKVRNNKLRQANEHIKRGLRTYDRLKESYPDLEELKND